MRKIICLTILVVLTSLSNVVASGGWPQPKGAIYVKLSQWWIIYNQYYNEHGTVISDRTRSIGHTSFYVEYGVTERFTAIAYMPFFSKATLFEQLNTQSGNIVEEGDRVTSVGDAQLAFKYNILNQTQAPLNISLSTILGIPLGVSNGGYDGTLQTGDGEFNQMLRIDVSGSVKVGNLYPYFSGFAAINNRTEGFSDDYRIGVEAGLDLSFITALCKIRSVKSLNNGKLNDQLVGTNFGGNNTEFVMVEPEIILNFSDHIGLSFTYSEPVSGRLIFSEPSYTIGISYKSNK